MPAIKVDPSVTELKVGLAGAGLIAGVHAQAYRASPGVRVVGIADPVGGKAQRLAEGHGASSADLDALLGSGATWWASVRHRRPFAEMAVAALMAERNVICEKPLGRTLEDARRVVDAADAARGLLMVGHVSRFEPDHRTGKISRRRGRWSCAAVTR